jgi:hypothetical protein
MEIRRDGTWFYEGTPIGRKPLVRLFSTILKREGGCLFPCHARSRRSGIRVEDAPFVARGFRGRRRRPGTGHQLHDECRATRSWRAPSIRHPRPPRRTGEPSPYVHVRAGLEALIDRKSFYRLVDLGEAHKVDGTDWFGVWSARRVLSDHPGRGTGTADASRGVSGHLYPGTPSENGPTIHLVVPDTLEAARSRLTAAGGTAISPDIEIPAGRFFYARDPDGNSIGLFQMAS